MRERILIMLKNAYSGDWYAWLPPYIILRGTVTAEIKAVLDSPFLSNFPPELTHVFPAKILNFPARKHRFFSPQRGKKENRWSVVFELQCRWQILSVWLALTAVLLFIFDLWNGRAVTTIAANLINFTFRQQQKEYGFFFFLVPWVFSKIFCLQPLENFCC